jgi:hypothetical protein
MTRKPPKFHSIEDVNIWFHVVQRFRPISLGQTMIATSAFKQDRRDADLMLQLVDYRSWGAYANVRQLQTLAGEDGCSVGGEYYRWVSPKWSDGLYVQL